MERTTITTNGERMPTKSCGGLDVVMDRLLFYLARRAKASFALGFDRKATRMVRIGPAPRRMEQHEPAALAREAKYSLASAAGLGAAVIDWAADYIAGDATSI
jgi:hypothetical protein